MLHLKVSPARMKERLTAVRGVVPAAFLAAALSFSPAAQAQQPAPPAQSAQPIQPGTAAEKKPQNSWVKLCQDQQVIKTGAPSTVKICLTHHERLSAANGMVLVSVAIRNISGRDKEAFMVLVPLGVALPPGLQAVIDDNKPIPLKFSFCHVGGCSAEAEATKEIVAQMKKGKQLKVLAINQEGKTIAFPVPLTGFTKAYDGGPVDAKKYHEARQKLMTLIRQRHTELRKKAAEAAKKKAAEQGKAATPPAQPKAQ